MQKFSDLSPAAQRVINDLWCWPPHENVFYADEYVKALEAMNGVPNPDYVRELVEAHGIPWNRRLLWTRAAMKEALVWLKEVVTCIDGCFAQELPSVEGKGEAQHGLTVKDALNRLDETGVGYWSAEIFRAARCNDDVEAICRKLLKHLSNA